MHSSARDAARAEQAKYDALTQKLASQTTGLPQDDANAAVAVRYVRENLAHHHFPDSSSEGDAVRAMFAGIEDRLERHAEHSKAAALRALTAELVRPAELATAGAKGWAWDVRHSNVGSGVAALAALYWLSDGSDAVNARLGWPDGRPPSLARGAANAAANAAAAEAVVAEARPSEPAVAWGYSDGEADDENDEEVEDAPATEAAEGQASDTAPPLSQGAEPDAAAAGPRERGLAHLARPPPHVRTDLLPLPALASASAAPAEGTAPSRRAESLGELRLVRETLRGLAGVEGAHWKMKHDDHPPAATTTAGGEAGAEPPPRVPCASMSFVASGASSDGHGAASQQPVPASGTAARSVLKALELPASRTAALGECAASLARTASGVLRGLGEGIYEELASARRGLWEYDEEARRAQQAVASGRVPRAGDAPTPTLLSLWVKLRHEFNSAYSQVALGADGGADTKGGAGGGAGGGMGGGSGAVGGGGDGGWMRKLATLDALRTRLSKHPAAAAALSGAAPDSCDAAAAASHALDSLVEGYADLGIRSARLTSSFGIRSARCS